MVYQLKRQQTNKRPQAFWGSLIPAAINFVGGLITSSQQAKAQRRALEEQQRLAQQQLDISNQNQLASTLNNYANAEASYDDKDYNLKYRIGGTKRLGSRNIAITDGGSARKIGNNTFLLRGGSHEDINETGQTGIGINVGGNEIEAEGGEVAQRKGNSLRIYSAQPILGGISPAQAVMRGYNKDKVFAAQQSFKRNNSLNDDGSKARHGTVVPYSRIHINNDGTFTDILDDKNYTVSATNGEDVVITGKANHWKEAGKKDTTSYYDPMGAVNFATAAAAPILNFTPSNIYGSIRDSKNANDFLRHYMMNDTGGFLNTEYAKDHPYLSLGVNILGDVGLGVGGNKIANILRNPMNYGKYGYKLNKLYKKAGLLDRGDYKTIQQNYDKNLDVVLGNRTFENNWYEYPIEVRNKAVNKNPDIFTVYITPDKRERDVFKYRFDRKAPKYHGQIVQPTHNGKPIGKPSTYYGYSWGSTGFTNKAEEDAYYNLMNHNPEYYKFLEEVNYPKLTYPWNEQRTVDEFLKRQQTSLRGVYANNKETAKNYLTTIKAYRKGGDRLDTNGGLYSSNSGGLAERFKNPDKGTSNGYIGKLFYNFDIDRSKPIADQLRAARMKVVRGGNNNVFAGTKYYKESIKDARRKGAVAIEDNYGRSNGDILNVTERAYLPGSAKEDELTLQNLEEYINQTNKSGRWNTDGIDFQKGDENYFIPREYNRFDDFIREARIFMKPRKAYDFNKETKFMKDVNYRTINRTLRRNYLLDKSRRLRGKDKIRDFNINDKIDIFGYMDAPFRYGGIAKYRLGGSSRLIKNMRVKDGWTAPVYNTKNYRVSDRMRKQIAAWESSARAAGRSNFIYRAGKYQNYSTAKETDAKKEALNRRVGARRIAKRIGGFTNPPVGSPKAEDGMLAPIYSYGTNRRKYPSFANIDLTARAIPNFNPIAIPKYTANSDSSFDPSDYNYLGRQSSFKPAAQDYIGLGIDTLSALSGSLFSRNAYKNLNFDYALPNYVDETPVAFDTTYHNEAQRANVERNRLNSRNLISGNTASAQGALSRMQQTDTDAMMETNKLLDEKSNKEVELRNQNLANEQQVRARNAAARNQYYQNVASIKNAAIQAKNEAELSRARQLSVDLSGLSQAWNNFASSVENRYDSRQNEIAAISSANNPSVVKNAISLGYDLSPEVLANLYKNTNNNELKGAILGRLNQRDRRRYGIE